MEGRETRKHRPALKPAVHQPKVAVAGSKKLKQGLPLLHHVDALDQGLHSRNLMQSKVVLSKSVSCKVNKTLLLQVFYKGTLKLSLLIVKA